MACNGIFLLCLGTFCLLTVIITITTFITAPEYHSKTHNKDSQNLLNHGSSSSDFYNIRRYSSNKEITTKISPDSVPNLRLKLQSYAEKDETSAIPAFYNGTLYYPTWGGYIKAVNILGGSIIWKKSLKELAGLDNSTRFVVDLTVSRTTPTIACDLLIVGIYGPAVVVAVNRSTGELVWSTQLSSNAASVITMSGTYYQGSFYIGTSCLEESLSIQQFEYCCTFRGSFFKLNAQTGAVSWQTFMLPDNGGETGEYAGAAICGSSPSIDKCRNLVYIAAGDLYSAPLRIRQCHEQQNNQTTTTCNIIKCVEPEDYSNSIMALDLDFGKIKWFRKLGGWFFVYCNNELSILNCRSEPRPDLNEFSEAPMVLRDIDYPNGTKRDVVFVLQQRTGFALALDRDYGDILWYKPGE
ncbi:PQQ-dependent membrane bound dehydrogenase, glucose/quinate/shikimate-related [Parasponia andersonii]|uniref:PQQ-dependent membrane bound dehydrogenase, glucose/quinate/shikimate-related n=1 Tax=Parasponia andersonii TaxID=3476 RepID=A0A2P5AFW1_PARAD|nr:PQQ-dependent membrane bound dehydrogenase, glucose/quinate/shikimate-related [Parasponia andersonii]